MKNIKFIGDIHGCYNHYKQLAYGYDGITIQVGDFGLGFGMPPPEIDEGNFFIRGNHDDPTKCKEHPNYLGDFGYVKEEDLFFLGGADSIDKALRVEGVSWWRDEQLTYNQFSDALDLYRKVKPKIVVTHDCPIEIKKGCIRPEYSNDEWTSTQQALQVMWQYEHHKPDLWIFGHYHPKQIKTFRLEGTKFVCLPIFGVYEHER